MSTWMPDTDSRAGWLSDDEIRSVRAHLPVVYIDAVPVRVDGKGTVTEVGLLLAQAPDGTVARTTVSGRVLYGETLRESLLRHIEKDLGSLALPRIPASPSPFTVAEYFPDVTRTGYHDPRQHAVSLAFLVPMDGDCVPSQSAIDLAWVTPTEAVGHDVADAFAGGRDRLLRLALAHAGVLP